MLSQVEMGYVVRWIAGDIVEVDVLEREGIYRRSIHRIFGMNAPEPNGSTREIGLRARERMAELTQAKDLRLQFIHIPETFLLPPRFKQYGRVLVRLFFENGVELADLAIQEGLAVPYYMGLGPMPNPFLNDVPRPIRRRSRRP